MRACSAKGLLNSNHDLFIHIDYYPCDFGLPELLGLLEMAFYKSVISSHIHMDWVIIPMDHMDWVIIPMDHDC